MKSPTSTLYRTSSDIKIHVRLRYFISLAKLKRPKYKRGTGRKGFKPAVSAKNSLSDCMHRTLSSFVKIEAGNSDTLILVQCKSGTNATVLDDVMATKGHGSESVIPDGAYGCMTSPWTFPATQFSPGFHYCFIVILASSLFVPEYLRFRWTMLKEVFTVQQMLSLEKSVE